MKFIPSQLAYLTTDREARANLRALARYLAFPRRAGHALRRPVPRHQADVEHEQHSWITGFYWTLVVMTTLGFGDITFTSDIGRAVQHCRAALGRRVSAGDAAVPVHPAVLRAVARGAGPAARAAGGAGGHAAATSSSPSTTPIAAGLVERLRGRAASRTSSSSPTRPRRPVVRRRHLGRWPARTTTALTYERRGRARRARMVLANCEDTTNTNITLTVREVAPDAARSPRSSRSRTRLTFWS